MFKKWGSWILLFTNFVPISLIVTLEMVKFIQGMGITRFRFNTRVESNIVVQSSTLNEELGQIEHLFSDKTGTLTCNYMNFKYMIVGGKTYGGGGGDKEEEQKGKENLFVRLPEVTNVDFKDKGFVEMFYGRKDWEMLDVVEYLLCLALCHSVIV